MAGRQLGQGFENFPQVNMGGGFGRIGITAPDRPGDRGMLVDKGIERGGVGQRALAHPIHLGFEIFQQAPGMLAIGGLGHGLMEELVEAQEFGVIPCGAGQALPLD